MVGAMKHRSLITASLLLASLAFAATPASAQARGRSAPRGGARATGQAVPRVGPPPRAARPTYRPYIYTNRPGVRVGVYTGFSRYPYRYYGSPFGYATLYSPYGYGYSGYYGSSYYGSGYYGAGYRGPYGGVRIKDAPQDAQVVVDGYYVGIVDDFDGILQQLTLEAGAHKIEIRTANGPALTFDVNVLPGQTITYRAPRP
jgi:hypothetical protein